MTSRAGECETLYVRERALALLEDLDFELVVDGVDRQDGWRAELFRRQESGEHVVLLAHKPQGVSYLTLAVVFDLRPPDSSDALLDLLDVASDYDVSCWFGRTGSPNQLSARLFVSSLNAADFRFFVENLLVCHDAFLDASRAGDERDDEASA